MGPDQYIFFKGGLRYKQNKVKPVNKIYRENKVILTFNVLRESVRLEIEQLSKTKYSKKFSCSCQEASLPNYQIKSNQAWLICNHIVATITWYSIMLAFKKEIKWKVK